MRMDDCLPAATPADEEAVAATGEPPLRTTGLRFTSNVVGSLFLLTDIICFIVAAPLTLAAYSLVRGSRLEVPAFVRMRLGRSDSRISEPPRL